MQKQKRANDLGAVSLLKVQITGNCLEGCTQREKMDDYCLSTLIDRLPSSL
jgi:hypothetical protein